MEGFLYFLLPTVLILFLTTFNKNTRNFFNQYFAEILTALGAIGLTVVDVMSDSTNTFAGSFTWKDSWVYLLIFFGLFLLIAIVVSAKRNLHNRTVQAEIDKNTKLEGAIQLYKKEYYDLCSNNILHLFNSFYTSGGERISIYKHQGDHFTLLGRYAKNHAHNKNKGYEYKENEGLIGRGWNEGEVLVTGAPKWVNKGTEYKKFMKERCQITDKRLNAINMHSRSIYVKTLDDPNTAASPDGIIVFESLLPSKVDKGECLILINQSQRALLDLLKSMSNLTRNLKK
jgi:hypothetical protein